MKENEKHHAELSDSLRCLSNFVIFWQNRKAERAEQLTSVICDNSDQGKIDFCIKVLKLAQVELDKLQLRALELEKELALSGVCAECGRSE
tara:strand:+ start:223 stop:495 length:273 start_codon:yes stop_codon:yes gene_type:complete